MMSVEELATALAAFAAEKRVDLLGIAPTERFADVPREHHPLSIFPETRSVVVLGKRIPRGALRGVEEGTQFELYGQYGQSWLVDRMLAITTIALATFLEDHRWEAVPIQDLPTEVPPSGVAVKPDTPAPNVMVDMRQAAVRAGLGEIGLAGEVLTPRFGPRQRFQLILTDAPLTPTPLLSEPVCDQCGECLRVCPLGAGSPDQTVTLTVAGKAMTVASLNLGACRTCRNGAKPNPHHPAGQPDRLAALCTRTCVHHLEQTQRIGNVFAQPFRARPAWQIDGHGRTTLRAEA
jgi:epoxyqueuosine reductase QueG